MKHYYTKAMLELLKEGTSVDEVLTNTVAVMKRRGHESLQRAVLEEVVRELERSESKEAVKVRIARQDDLESALKTLKEASVKTDKVETIIDPSIIGGMVARDQDSQIDTSHKSALTRLYQQITK